MQSRLGISELVARSRSRRCGRAFTLIEVLVVIAVIAILVAILLPAIGHAKRSAQSAVSLANLGQCGQLQTAYSLDYRGSFVNPFDSKNPQTWGVPWYDIIGQSSLNGGPVLVYGHGDSEYCTEQFAEWWGGLMAQYINSTTAFSSVLTSPNDTVLLDRNRKRFDQSIGVVDGYMFETSYWASPTLWLSTEPFRTASRVSIGYSDSRYWRRNRFDDVASPEAKVMVFERFDFTKTSRSHRAGGRENYSPTFNNTEARTRFVTTDGSVSSVDMARLAKLASAANPNQRLRDMYTPAGMWDIPDLVLGDPLIAGPRNLCGRDALENGDGSLLNISGGFKQFQAFFWGTRNGIQGRDVPK